MDAQELKSILVSHGKWLANECGGKRANLLDADLHDADLRDADLRYADLRGADLSDANLLDANLRGANLLDANLHDADLRDADLRDADLRDADLRGADLRGADLSDANLLDANLDFSCWPLWCGSLDVKCDKRIAAQLAYHFCRLDCDDPDYVAARNAIIDFANKFHRVDECGEIDLKGRKP